MRNIEEKMVNAIKSGKNFALDNTQVVVNGNICEVYLHGNKIFTYNRATGSWTADTCGYETNTTKSRLNACLDCVNAECYLVQHNFSFYWCSRHTHEKHHFGRTFSSKSVKC